MLLRKCVNIYVYIYFLRTYLFQISSDSDVDVAYSPNVQTQFIHRLKKTVTDLAKMLEYAELNFRNDKLRNVLLKEQNELNKDFCTSIELSSQEMQETNKTNTRTIEHLFDELIKKHKDIELKMKEKDDELDTISQKSKRNLVEKDKLIGMLKIDLKKKDDFIGQLKSKIKQMGLTLALKMLEFENQRNIIDITFLKIHGLDPWELKFENIPDSGRLGMVIFYRKYGSLSFDRDRSDYLNGFGDPYGEFWLGCKSLNILTGRERCELYIQLIYENDERTFAKYNHFRIESEALNFQIISLGAKTGNANIDLKEGYVFDTYTDCDGKCFQWWGPR